MKILIAVDGSEYSNAAIEKCGLMFAGSGKHKLKVLSVYESYYPVASEPFAVSPEYYQDLEREAKTQAEEYVSDAATILGNKYDELVVETEIKNGSPAQAIVEVAQESETDLIIVGSHGRGFWGRMMIGSVSDAVMHHAPCSVLIVRS